MPNFSSLPFSLSDLTKKGQPDQLWWTKEIEWAFDSLKQALTSLPVLRNLNFSLPFIIHMDTSETGLGAILFSTSAES